MRFPEGVLSLRLRVRSRSFSIPVVLRMCIRTDELEKAKTIEANRVNYKAYRAASCWSMRAKQRSLPSTCMVSAKPGLAGLCVMAMRMRLNKTAGF